MNRRPAVPKRNPSSFAKERVEVTPTKLSKSQVGLLILLQLIFFALFGIYYDPLEVYKERLKFVTVVEGLWADMQGIAGSARMGWGSVGVGYNACLDLIVRGRSWLEGVAVPERAVLHERVLEMREFEELMRYAWENGAAVERFIEDSQLCSQIIQKAQQLEDKTYHNGGNAALMGLKFNSKGVDVLLGGAVGEHTKPLLPPNIKIANQDGHDEIHLILEFSRGERWGEVTAPRDNRLIVHCDYTNSRINVLEEFHSALVSFQPELVVITGIHLLEREKPTFRTDRLQTIVSEIKKIKNETPVHFELASNSDIDFIAEVGNTILPHVDSLGLNEQELGYLYASLGGTKIDKSEVPHYVKKYFKEPKVQTISNALTFIFKNIKTVTREFSRIHFHYLKYHIVAQKKDSRWEPGKESVVVGSVTASSQSCQFNDTQNPDEQFFVPFSSETSTLEAVRSWEEKGIEFYLSPVLVCKSPKKTVGLGDAISAMGLLYHQPLQPKPLKEEP